MSEKRRRSGEGATGKKILVWCAWGAVVALLGGNLAMAFLNRDPATGEPSSPITPDLLKTALFWVPVAACVVVSILGLFWTSRAYAQTERNSLLWARRGHAFSLVGAIVLTMAVYDAELVPRDWLAGVASLLVGGQTVFFAMLGFREYRRAETGEGSRHTRGRRGQPDRGPAPATPDSVQ